LHKCLKIRGGVPDVLSVEILLLTWGCGYDILEIAGNKIPKAIKTIAHKVVDQ